MNLLVTNDDAIDSAFLQELLDRCFGCPTWAVDGTPSDCVNIADNSSAGPRTDIKSLERGAISESVFDNLLLGHG